MFRRGISHFLALIVAIGLVGIAQPAYATPPTVSVQFMSAGCVQDGGITTYASGENWLDNWQDGDILGLDVKFVCAGREFSASFNEVTLDSGAEVTLQIALPAGLKFTQSTGTIGTAWGEECLDPTYKVGGTVNIDWGSEGSFSDPQIQYVYYDVPDSDGNFAFDLPLTFSVFPEYPAQNSADGTWLGQDDQAAGDAYAEQCHAGLEYGSSDYAVKKGSTFRLLNQTAEMTYQYNFPPGTSESECNMDLENLPETYVDTRWVHWGTTVTVSCTDLGASINLPIDGDFAAGQSHLVDVDIPTLEWVTVTGHVDFTNPMCQSFDPQIRTNASDSTWDNSASASIDGSGNFTLQVPSGSRNLSIDVSESSSSPEWAYDTCNLSSRYSRTWHFDEDTSGLQLVTASATVVDVTLSQPDVNDTAESCSLYSPDEGDIPDGQALDELQTIAYGTSDVVNVRAYCGRYMRDFNVSFTRLSSTSGVAELQVPDLNITLLKGSISLPKGYPATRAKDLEVSASPFLDQQDGDSSKGWYFDSGWMAATVNTEKLTYEIEVVDGDYLFSVSTSAQPSSGCYLQSYFPGTALQFATPVRISESSTRGPKLALIHGGQIIGNATFSESIRYTPGGLIDQVYDENGQSFAWRAGDGTGIASNGDFMNMLCLPPGDYYYQAGNPFEGVKSQFYPGVTSLAKASKVTIPNGADSTRIEMAFTPVDRGRVSGIVLDENGDPLSGYTVYAYDESSESFQSTESAEDGSFELASLDTPSDYSIHAFDSNVYWGGSTSDYVYYPGVGKADAVPITLTEISPSAEGIVLEVPGDLAGLTMWDLDPRYGQINVPAPAESFDGLIDDLLNGDVTLDMENETLITRSRGMNRMITDYDLDVEVNFNSIDDSQVAAFSYATGGDAATIGSLTLGDDVARVKGQVDLNDGINFITVTGADSLRTVAVPILVGDVQPTIASAPDVTGKLTVGKKVSTTPGGWLASPAIDTYKYQWKLCSSNDSSVCVDINKQTKPQFTLTKKQKGKFLAVTVTATNSSGAVSFTKVYGKVR